MKRWSEPEEPDETVSAGVSVGDPDLGKSRLLSRQCDTCVFAPGNKMHLAPGRLRDLVAEARARESFIVCHSTLPHYRHPDAQPAICRGFADRYRTQALRFIERLFGFIEVDPPQADPQPATPDAAAPSPQHSDG
ncbi:hypothetical protein M2302_006280 [Micromonospora sp. A200]|uniref:hypothetical protein n=1 Tax=Micromonospora sp. A200 TaxID=2940568 RepID=UPI0024736975|nr:hypothetical protein [Micromonospora sp. A200]MDH6466074.1 hypothetical protein [Micromonospora sp. A200]